MSGVAGSSGSGSTPQAARQGLCQPGSSPGVPSFLKGVFMEKQIASDRVIFLGDVCIADILWMNNVVLRCGQYAARRLSRGCAEDISWALGILAKAYGVSKKKFSVLNRDIPKQWTEMANRFHNCGRLFKGGNK